MEKKTRFSVALDKNKLSFFIYCEKQKVHFHVISIVPNGRETIDIDEIENKLLKLAETCEICNQK